MAKVTFVYPGFESLGIKYISSYVKAHGHSSHLVFDPRLFQNDQIKNLSKLVQKRNVELREILVDEVLASNPDIVAFSVVTDFYQWALDFASDIKKKREDLPIIFGGIHPTSVPDIVIKQPQVDMVCVGEGEEAMLELLNDINEYISKRKLCIKNLWFKCDNRVYENKIRELTQDLDKYPFPDNDLFYNEFPEFKLQYNIITGRGCPYQCTYCCNNFLAKMYRDNGKYLRRRSVDNVIEELKIVKKKIKSPLIFFRDEVFIYNLPWLKEFSERYRTEIAVPFKCFTHPSLCSQEIIRELHKAGCVYVSMGIQSATEKTRKNILHRYDTNNQIENAMNLFHRYKISVNVDQIAGIPGEGEQELIEAAKFYDKIRPGIITYFWLTLYPRTDMVQIFREQGLASEEEINKFENGQGHSDFLGGSVKENKDLFMQFRTLLCYIPLLPSFVVKLILKFKLYRFMALKSLALSTLLPRLILAPFNSDVSAWIAELGYEYGKMKYVRRKLQQKTTR